MNRFLKIRAALRLVAIVLSVLSLVSIAFAQAHSAACELGEDCCSEEVSTDSCEPGAEGESPSDQDQDAPLQGGCTGHCSAGCCAGPLVFAIGTTLSVTFEFTLMTASPTEALASATSEGSQVSVFRPPRLFA